MIHSQPKKAPAPVIPDHFLLRSSNVQDMDELVRLFRQGNLGIEDAEDFANTFCAHASYCPKHVLVIEHGKMLVGTASAFVDREDHTQGFLHMVSVDTNYRRLGLGRILVLAALRLHAFLGLRQQWLLTDDSRIEAIRLYFSLGYQPCVNDFEHAQRWKNIEQLTNA